MPTCSTSTTNNNSKHIRVNSEHTTSRLTLKNQQ
jgi:hypothetical protein